MNWSPVSIQRQWSSQCGRSTEPKRISAWLYSAQVVQTNRSDLFHASLESSGFWCLTSAAANREWFICVSGALQLNAPAVKWCPAPVMARLRPFTPKGFSSIGVIIFQLENWKLQLAQIVTKASLFLEHTLRRRFSNGVWACALLQTIGFNKSRSGDWSKIFETWNHGDLRNAAVTGVQFNWEWTVFSVAEPLVRPFFWLTTFVSRLDK